MCLYYSNSTQEGTGLPFLGPCLDGKIQYKYIPLSNITHVKYTFALTVNKYDHKKHCGWLLFTQEGPESPDPEKYLST